MTKGQSPHCASGVETRPLRATVAQYRAHSTREARSRTCHVHVRTLVLLCFYQWTLVLPLFYLSFTYPVVIVSKRYLLRWASYTCYKVSARTFRNRKLRVKYLLGETTFSLSRSSVSLIWNWLFITLRMILKEIVQNVYNQPNAKMLCA